MKLHYRPPEQPKHSPGKHATPWHKAVAGSGTILRAEVGSSVHGTAVSGYDDRDEMGVCIEPIDAVIGFRQFEQYEWHTAWERPGGRANRSGHGDLDEVVYSLRKWMRLAMNGNPSVLVLLFAPDDKLITCTNEGVELRRRMPQYIVSRKAGARFAGYLHAQRAGLLSREGKGRDVTRPELIKQFGYDTKFAGHMVRLGYQGVELLQTGCITLPMPASQRQVVSDIRLGKYTMNDCLEMAADLEADIAMLTDPACDISPLPYEPDYDTINRWLGEIYTWWWVQHDIEENPLYGGSY